MNELVEALPTVWLENYMATYEAGRVQERPHARFVNAKGECCLVAAMASSRSGAAFAGSVLWTRFLGTELEELSRRFESRRVTGQDVYEEVLLALTRRRVPASPTPRGPAARMATAIAV